MLHCETPSSVCSDVCSSDEHLMSGHEVLHKPREMQSFCKCSEQSKDGQNSPLIRRRHISVRISKVGSYIYVPCCEIMKWLGSFTSSFKNHSVSEHSDSTLTILWTSESVKIINLTQNNNNKYNDKTNNPFILLTTLELRSFIWIWFSGALPFT